VELLGERYSDLDRRLTRIETMAEMAQRQKASSTGGKLPRK
jgi:hypothetical protein